MPGTGRRPEQSCLSCFGSILSGFAYVVAGIGLALWKPWGVALAALIAGSILVGWVVFAVHALSGGDYETRTVMAMTLRAAIWLGIAFAGCRTLGCVRARDRALIGNQRIGDKE
jgi:hypothetical protein